MTNHAVVHGGVTTMQAHKVKVVLLFEPATALEDREALK